MNKNKNAFPYIYGAHAVQAALKNPQRKCQLLLLSKGIAPEVEALLPQNPDIKVKHISPEDMMALLGRDTVHQGIALKASPLPQLHIEDVIANCSDQSCLLVLDQVTDPQNVGATMRSAAAFGAKAVIQQDKNAPNTTSPALIKAASGAVEEIPLVTVTNLSRALESLKKAGFWCIGLDEQGQETLPTVKLTGRVALVLGREGKGLRQLTRETCDILAKLPTGKGFSTLNVSNAAAVSLYEWRRQHDN